MPLTEEQKQYQKQYREQNREKLNEYRKKYKEQNRDKILAYKKQYREQNREKLNECRKKYNKTLNGSIRQKIIDCKTADEDRGRENNITGEYIIQLLEKYEYKCNNCKIEIKTEWEDAYDPLQYSVNRINNNIGHIVGNCEITCLLCNCKLAMLDRNMNK